MSNTIDAKMQHRPAFSVAGTVPLAVAGFATALFGVYWDDAWHTDRGRDEFLSAPHLALYLGVAVAVGVVVRWGWHQRLDGSRAVVSGPIGVGVVGALVTLGSAPVDEWWHTAFGRDAVLWSPPHLLALVGTIALGSGVLLVAGRSSSEVGKPGILLLAASGAGVIGGWQVLVLEYDTDVAQFSPLWYLPIMAAGLSAAALMVQSVLFRRVRWPATLAGLAYTAMMIVVIGLLRVTDFSPPIVPAVVPALAAADFARRRGWSVLTRALSLVVALFVVYVPYLSVVPGGVSVTIAEAALGVAIAAAAVAATILFFDPLSAGAAKPGALAGGAMTVSAFAVVVLALASVPPPAAAHDPGQGIEVADIALSASTSGRLVTVTAESAAPETEPVRIVARRAGRLLEGSLAADATGAWVGDVQLDRDGRWFIYVEATTGQDRLEAWLPVKVGVNVESVTTKRTALYGASASADSTTAQLLVGAILVALSAAIIARVVVTVRSTFKAPISSPSS